ncbi:MAG: putative molybdenum carrier protein [Desulfobacterales bacterium]|nr:putative molybdenum carrier protein [Desulfobacterales bacterium]
MLKKIISGGQTGVDRAALDAAIKLMIPHGGWIPRGRLAEDGPLPPIYKLKETNSTSYPDRTEKNVLEADGTLIISRGPLTGGSEFTREMAVKHGRPWLHIDLSFMPAFQAAKTIQDWILNRDIETLNVAGARASKDPRIYRDTLDILESAYYLGLVHGGMNRDSSGESPRESAEKPYSVEAAVNRLTSLMSLKDKATVANMSYDELPSLYHSLGDYIINSFGPLSGNPSLLESCREEYGRDFDQEEDAVAVIIKALWKKLHQTHRLRVLK